MKNPLLRMTSYILVAALSSFLTMAIHFWMEEDSKLEELLTTIEHFHIDDPDRTNLEDTAASAMVQAAGDQWSYYIPAAEYAAYVEDTENAYVGIGITIVAEEDGSGLRVVQMFVNGPAAEAGIQLDDVIIAVEGNSMEGMTPADARNLVRGEEGTLVQITVRRGEEELEFYVPRRTVEQPVAAGQMLTEDVGLITIYDFETRCAVRPLAILSS